MHEKKNTKITFNFPKKKTHDNRKRNKTPLTEKRTEQTHDKHDEQIIIITAIIIITMKICLC